MGRLPPVIEVYASSVSWLFQVFTFAGRVQSAQFSDSTGSTRIASVIVAGEPLDTC
jgi:hypothetical protein